MKMKKILSVAAVLAIAASLGVSASAAETPNHAALDATTTNQVELTKKYDVTGNSAVNPNDDLTFTVGTGVVTEATDPNTVAPAVTVDKVEIRNGAKEAAIKINLPVYEKVGVYTYDIQETNNGVAGVTYVGAPLKLVVTVTSDKKVYYAVYDSANTKTDEITNKYEAGSLAVSEKTTGNLGDKDKVFNATVTFTAPDNEKANGSISFTDDGENKTVTWGADGKTATATITLKDGETITFDNLPNGTTYTVVETEANQDDYTTSYDGNKDAEKSEGKVTTTGAKAEIENNKAKDVDTGINLDNLPYALALAGVAVAGGSIVIRRRRVND